MKSLIGQDQGGQKSDPVPDANLSQNKIIEKLQIGISATQETVTELCDVQSKTLTKQVEMQT